MPVGFLDHTDGGSAFALVAPALAVGWGANLVEKHFTLDRSEKGYDYQSSLNPEDFYRMVELLRQAEQAAGDGAPPRTARPRTATTARWRATSWPARSSSAATCWRRRCSPSSAPTSASRAGFAPREAHRVIGRRAGRPIQADETIREDMLE